MGNLNGSAAHAISPIDGRYAEKTKELNDIFSEFGLMKARLIVEVEYLIALIYFLRGTEIRQFFDEEVNYLRNLYDNFSDEDFEKIKSEEVTTHHDVKAVEYYLRRKLSAAGLGRYSTYVHLGRTSEDINNLAEALMLKYGTQILSNLYSDVAETIRQFAYANKNVPMPALTHGQLATPTTVGWTMIVYFKRLDHLLSSLIEFFLSVKMNGATGADNALFAAYPELDWHSFTESFVKKIGEVEFVKGVETDMRFEVNRYTFQIEPHDTYKVLFEILTGLNVALLDFNKDMWTYISLEYFSQKIQIGEVGSSAMPQKINPIDFENSEGNLGKANSDFEFFCQKLPISRLYRDLSDSTVERNFGVAYAHTLIALKSLKRGMGKIVVNIKGLNEKLGSHWEVISEAYQIILRVNGVEKGYELVADEVKGKKVTRESMHAFVDRIALLYNLPCEVVKRLKSITPFNYLGDRSF